MVRKLMLSRVDIGDVVLRRSLVKGVLALHGLGTWDAKGVDFA